MEITNAIYRCLAIKFFVRANLNRKDFIHEVLTTVIRPLEEYASCLNWMAKGKGLSTAPWPGSMS